MVDPVGGPDRAARAETPGGLRTLVTTLVAVGLGRCLVLIGVILLFGMMALPWVASGLFFYRAAQAVPAANRYQQAPPCPADGSPGTHCLRLVRGTIAAVDKHASRRALTTQFSIELPSGIQSSRMTTFALISPPSWLQVGQSVDVTLYEGKITQVASNGSQADTDDNPVVHQHDLFITGFLALVFGLVLDGGIFIRMRRGKKGSGLPAS